MLLLHPVIRMICAMLIIFSIFMATSLDAMLLAYVFILLLTVLSKTTVHHIKFLIYVTSPLLAVLLILWGLIVPDNQIPKAFSGGVTYAIFTWIRIIACGGAIQALFMPLIESPSYLKDLFKKSGLGSIGVLVASAIIFLPELRRRLSLVMDARRAQGEKISGISGLKNLPTLLMPLVSSLLDSSNKRAELWSHRGIIRTDMPNSTVNYSIVYGATLLLLSVGICLLVNWI